MELEMDELTEENKTSTAPLVIKDNLVSVKRRVKKDGRWEIKKLNYYYTDGRIIRDAITGNYHFGNMVGTKDEDNFFKVRILNGETGSLGPVTLFYNGRNEYEKHQMIR